MHAIDNAMLRFRDRWYERRRTSGKGVVFLMRLRLKRTASEGSVFSGAILQAVGAGTRRI
jgi:hypothetical protein